MRYTLELELEANRERVLELFLNPENLKKWQPSLVTYEALTEGPLKVGSQSKQLHRMGTRETEMIETITVANYPDEYAAMYESGDVWNLIENRFEVLDENRTKWTLTSDFKSTNWIMKIIMVLSPGSFKKMTSEFMGYFKEFVESSPR